MAAAAASSRVRSKITEATTAGLSLDLSISFDEFKEKMTTFLTTNDAAERSSIAEDIGTPHGSICICRSDEFPCFCISTEGYLSWLSATLEKPESFTYNAISVAQISDATQNWWRKALTHLYYKCEMPTCDKQVPVIRLIGLLNEALPGKANKTKRLAIEDKMEQMMVIVITKKFPYAFGYCKNDDCERSKSGKPFIARSTFTREVWRCRRDPIEKYRVQCPDCKVPTCTICRSKIYHKYTPCPGLYLLPKPSLKCSITNEIIKPEHVTRAIHYTINLARYRGDGRLELLSPDYSDFYKTVCVFPLGGSFYAVPKIVDEREIYLMVIKHLLEHLPYEIVQKIVGYLGSEQRIEYLTIKSFPFTKYVIDVPEKYRVNKNKCVSIDTLMEAIFMKHEMEIVKSFDTETFHFVNRNAYYHYNVHFGFISYLHHHFRTYNEMERSITLDIENIIHCRNLSKKIIRYLHLYF